MENHLKNQIAHCAEQVDRYANRTDRDSRNQWWYWMGQLRACRSILEHIQSVEKLANT